MKEETKVCSVCNKPKTLDYYCSAGIKKGKQYYRKQCRDCFGNKKRLRRVHNAKWMAEHKTSLKCEKCGYSAETNSDFTPRALQFHHHNNDKDFHVADGVHRGMSIKRLQKEMAKCKVLCSRCHVEAHND